MKRAAMIECMDNIETGMNLMQNSRDIWQNNLIYWLCRSVWLLLEYTIKEHDKRKV